MCKKILYAAIVILIVLLGLPACSDSTDDMEYVVLIGESSENLEKFPCAEVLVIDGDYFTADDIAYLKSKGVKKIYSYLNIGSIEEYRDCYEKYLKYTLGEYENWPDEKWIDVSREEWQSYIVLKGNELSEKGFDGFFIDNTDVYYMFPTEEIYDGIVDILTQLKNDNMDVIINGGDAFVRKYLASQDGSNRIFDGVNQEEVYTNYNFEDGKFKINTKENREYYQYYLENLLSKGYSVYVLEYADEKKVQNEAARYAREHGFIAYVADNIDLKI